MVPDQGNSCRSIWFIVVRSKASGGKFYANPYGDFFLAGFIAAARIFCANGSVVHCWTRRNLDFVEFPRGEKAKRSQSFDNTGIYTTRFTEKSDVAKWQPQDW